MLLRLLLSIFKGAFVGLAFIIPAYWIYVRYICHSFWTRKYKIRQLNPSSIFGNYGKVILRKVNVGEHLNRLYKETKDDYVGTYFFTTPALIVRNPQIIEEILTDETNFKSSFYEEYLEEESVPKLTIDRRNEILNKISSFLTPNTLSSLHETLQKTVQNLLFWLNDEVQTNSNKIDIGQILYRYNLDMICNLTFGTEIHSIFNPNVTFRKMTDKMMREHMKRQFIGYSPLSNIWRVNDGHVVERFFFSLVRLEVNYREENRLERSDLLQLILQLRNGNKFRDGRWKLFVQDNESSKEISLTEVTMILQDLLRAGLDLMTSSLMFCLVELAQNFDIQGELYDVISKVFAKNEKGYQDIQQLETLDLFLKETLRLHPCQAFIERRTCGSVTLPGQTNPLPDGTLIFVPVTGIHTDEQFFENPHKFVLKRMKETEPSAFTFIPFGKGCFFEKLIEMSFKSVLCEILLKYEVKLDQQKNSKDITKVILEFTKRTK